MKSGSSGLRASLMFFLPFFGVVTNLGAQTEEARDPRPSRPYVGLIGGGGELPVAFHTTCPSDFEDRSSSYIAGLVFGIPLRPFHLETRNLRRELVGRGQDCFVLDRRFPSGIHTERVSGVGKGDMSTSDLRLGYGLPFRYPVVASAGAGWVWGNDLPFLSLGLGLRTTGRARFTFEVLWEAYWMPFELLTREWQDFRVLRTVDREKRHDWQHAWSFQIGIAGYIR